MALAWDGQISRVAADEELAQIRAIVDQYAKGPSKVYPLATILNPRRNISIRKTPAEIRREILAWIIAAVSLALIVFATAETLMDLWGKK